jgi:flap endonuclease-1
LGVNLTPIIVKSIIKLEDIAGRSIAVDANNILYQFLSLIRTRTTIPLMGPDGTVTSHLAGLLYRTTRLMSEYNMKLVFVFDGNPPVLKKTVIEKRRKIREKSAKEWKQALKAGDYSTAFSKAVMSNKLSRSMIEDAKKLLALLGVPHVQAPCEAESQAAYMAMRGDVWASNSRDYDSLLFGTPRLVRYLTISGREFLPSKGVSRPLEPEIIELQQLLKVLGITREQLIDIAILIGTDFNEGVKGIGPKTSLKLIRKHGGIENLPSEIREKLTSQRDEIRSLFLKPEVTSDYSTVIKPIKEDELYAFLCEEKGFSRSRVERAIRRVAEFSTKAEQPDLNKWLPSSN